MFPTNKNILRILKSFVPIMTLKNTVTCVIENKMHLRKKSHSETQSKLYHLNFIKHSISLTVCFHNMRLC